MTVGQYIDFASLPVPSRLTPSPPPFTGSELLVDNIAVSHELPTSPLRKSIYPHPFRPTWHINVVPYSPDWPAQFEAIRSHLHGLFTSTVIDNNTSTADSGSPSPTSSRVQVASYQTIEHIGSTSIPNLAAKPNIDVLVTFANEETLNAAIEALNWELPTTEPPFAKYTQCPRGGGIPGRESFKLYLPEDHPYYVSTPERSVYLIVDVPKNEAGRVQIRCYRTVRDVLRQDENRDLLEEYGDIKLKLARESFADPLEYSARKDGIVRKILKRGGWTDEEVDRKELLTRRVYVAWDEGEEPY